MGMPENFEKIRKIGRGTYSKVYSVQKEGQIYALKKCPIHPDSEHDAGVYYNTILELNVLKIFQHAPGFNQLIDVIYRRNHVYLVLEKMDCDLHQYTRNKSFEERNALTIPLLIQCTQALDLMDQVGYHHFDVKRSNILVRGGEVPIFQLADFGLSLSNISYRNISDPELYTAWYRPPQFFPNRKKNLPREALAKCDIWALGIVIMEVLIQIPLFPFTWRREFYAKLLKIGKDVQYGNKKLKKKHLEKYNWDNLIYHELVSGQVDVEGVLKSFLEENEYDLVDPKLINCLENMLQIRYADRIGPSQILEIFESPSDFKIQYSTDYSRQINCESLTQLIRISKRSRSPRIIISLAVDLLTRFLDDDIQHIHVLACLKIATLLYQPYGFGTRNWFRFYPQYDVSEIMAAEKYVLEKVNFLIWTRFTHDFFYYLQQNNVDLDDTDFEWVHQLI